MRERAAAVRERAAAARERVERAADPRLSEPALAPARAACARQAAGAEPYMFGFGMQDVTGAVEGLLTLRAALARSLRGAARDDLDRGRLRPLMLALAAGDRALVRIANGDRAAIAGSLERFDAQVAREQRVARRLGLGDCVVGPSG